MGAEWHAPLGLLADYRDGQLHGAELRERVELHLAGCPGCQARLAALEDTLATLRAASRHSAPVSVLEAARALYRERWRQPERRPLLARLVFDGGMAAAPSGARGGPGQSFQMVFSAGDLEMELWQEELPGGTWHVIAQVLAAEAEAPRVLAGTLAGPGGVPVAAQLQGSELHFTDVPAGPHILRVELADSILVADPVRVGL